MRRTGLALCRKCNMLGFLKRRRRPEPSLVRAIRAEVHAAVAVSFIAHAERDFGPDWQRVMASMDPAEKESWLDKHFPDTPT